MGAFYKAFGDCVYPIMFGGEKEIKADAKARLPEVLGWVNDMIKETGYAAGTKQATIADYAFLATYSTIKASAKCLPYVDLNSYAETNAWFEKMKKEAKNYDKADGLGAKMFGDWAESKF